MVDFSLITHCRGCHGSGDGFEVVLQMDPMPLAGQFCRSEAEAKAATKFPLTWLRCGRCGLVQVGENVSDDALYENYNYASSSVPGLVRHFEAYAEFLTTRFGADESVSLLEIGCNDGVLLNRLPSSWRLLGVDPSDVAHSARGVDSGYELVSAPFTPSLVESQGWEGEWDVITGSNCLAHISDLQEVFRGVRLALRNDGWFWVEVHDLEALLDGAQWDTIYHEHKVEWSVSALQRCVEALGFALKVVDRLPLHGGVIRCGFQAVTGALHPEWSRPEPVDGLYQLADAYRDRFEHPGVQQLMQTARRGDLIAAYGASGRANVYLNQLPELSFAFIVDEAPLRQNRFIPVVATPIVEPGRLVEQRPSQCLVTAWNYRDDIVRKNQAYAGGWLTVFPVL